MDNLEKWEEIISSKYNGQEIPFDEMDWDKAEEKIDAMEKKIKRKKRVKRFIGGSWLRFLSCEISNII